MKKFVIFFLASFFLLIFFVKAESLEINVQPKDAWMENDVTISCWYLESTTTPPWAYIIKDTSSWTKPLIKINDTYYQNSYKPPILGSYQVLCSNGTINSTQVSFQSSDLIMNITSYPETAYLGNKISLHAKVIKKSDSDQVITTEVDFQLFLGSKSVPIDSDATYLLGNEWVITSQKLSLSDFISSSYTLVLKSTYNEKTVSDSRNINIKTPVEFELISTDKNWIIANDNITFTFKALYEGNTFDFKKEYLKIWVNSKEANILEISRGGQLVYVKVSMPDLQPGTYKLDIRFTYMDFVKDISQNINYVLPISGSIINSDNEAVYVQLKFKSNTTDVTYVTDASGSYSGYLPPGIYDVEMDFQNSKLILNEVAINQFKDPIKYDHPSTDLDIPGIGVGGVYVYEIALTYSDAYLEMRYDDSKITDESRINIYKCENWNFGRKLCNSNWVDVKADIDTVRNTVKINITELSAFLVGYKKNLYLDFNLDKEEYYLKDIIKVTGTLEDEEKNAVQGAQIKVSIPNTAVSASSESDASGMFVLEFQGPEQEGNYDIIVQAEKSPFANVNMTKDIKMLKSIQLLILMPESIKIKQGENFSIPIDLVNNGQTDFSGLKLSLDGVPEEFVTLSKTEIPELKASVEEKISIDFVIPKDAIKANYPGKFRITYGSKSFESEFILSILTNEKNETDIEKSPWFKLPSFSLPTGMLVLPEMSGYILLVIIASISISSIIFKVKKSDNSKLERKLERSSIKNLLIDIKREIETRSSKKKG